MRARQQQLAAVMGTAVLLVGGAPVAADISADDIRRHTVVLGSDAMEGRAPGTDGGRRAADYLVRELASARVTPSGDAGRYEQRVPLHAAKALAESRFEVWNLGRTKHLLLGVDYLLATAGSQTLIPRRVPMVFVGYGIVAPEFDYNDYRGIDVRGAVVVYLAGEPSSDDADYFDGPAPSVYAAPETKAKIALTRGAVGSLLVPRPQPGFDQAWEHARREYARDHLSLAYTLPEHLNAMLHPDVAEWLFSDALYDFAAILEMLSEGTLRSFHLPAEMSFHGRFRERDVVASNIIGHIPGADPDLADNPVILLAHYDHLGVGTPVGGDSIYNGVIDNAIGVSCVLEIARALAAEPGRHRRPVIVLLTTAEEAGLLGARSFLADPPVPPARMAAAVNVDGIAFLSPFNDVVGIGGDLSDLGSRLARAVHPLGLEVAPPPDSVWDRVAYTRGDQLAFAQAGVPSILVNEGFDWPEVTRDEAVATALRWMDERYHSPQDDLSQPIDYQASSLHCRAIHRLVLEIANNPDAPVWDPRSEYAYERLLSLALDR